MKNILEQIQENEKIKDIILIASIASIIIFFLGIFAGIYINMQNEVPPTISKYKLSIHLEGQPSLVLPFPEERISSFTNGLKVTGLSLSQ